MLNDEYRHMLKQRLLEFAETIPKADLLPTLIPEAAPLVTTDPYAFSLATCLDRGTKADIIWTIPYYIKQDLGHLDPQIIYRMSLDELAELFARLPKRPRYVNDAPMTVRDLTRIVVDLCGGDASNIWTGKSAASVKRTFMSIHGVGPGIANMGVLLIEKAFNIRFNDLDRPHMDIKPDVHTVRVLYRLGASDAQTIDAALDASRRLSPEFPGAIDGALWELGRRYCFASNPNCPGCPMNNRCEHRI
ncbi:MAG: hypothetical protein JW902_00660 [Syntrophaceae bacterium]|nr:hypothetical protein [Syntrophaceae bacterium]